MVTTTKVTITDSADNDGQLYVAGLKGWQTSAGHDGALQRVRYTQKVVRDVSALHVTPRGLQITFTVPLKRDSIFKSPISA